MADLSYDSYLNSNKKTTTNKLSYDSYLTSQQPKKTLGEKITNVAKGVTKFVGGEKLSEAIGGTIAINRAEKKGDIQAMADIGKTLPTNKQTLASIGEVALNTVPLGVGLGKGAKTATKIATSIPRLIGEGAAYGAAQSGLRSVQEGNNILSKETAKSTAVGGALGGAIGGVLGGVGKLISNKVSKVANEVPIKKVVYSGEPITKETVGGTKFFTPNKEVATKYADINKNVTGKSQVVEKDITGLNLKKVTQAEMQDAVEDPIIKQNYDGIEFKVAGEKEPSYAIFDKPKEVAGTKPSIESTRLNENLVKQGFDELPAEQKATYNAFQVKEQTDKITKQLDTNYDGFKQSVLDNKIPSDIQPTMAFNAVKNKAIQEGDFETQRLLAKSPLASLSSQAGSTLRATQEFSIDGADSVTIMNKLNQELEKTTEKKLGKSIKQAKQELVNNAENIYKSEVKKITSKQSVADFINSIPDC